MFADAGLDASPLKDVLLLDLAKMTTPWLRTPRDVVRFSNRVRTMAGLAVAAELSPEDFACELLAVFVPELSNAIGANKTAALVLRSPFDEFGSQEKGQAAAERARAVFEPLMEKLGHEQRSGVMRALQVGLPGLHAALSNETYHGGPPAARRLAHEAYFDRYFSYTAWADDVPDREVERRWHAVIDGEPFGSALAELLNDGSRYVLRDKLIKAMDDNPPTGERATALVCEMESLAGADDWLDAVKNAPMWAHRPVIVDVDVLAAHAVRLAHSSSDDPGVAEAFEMTTLPDFAYHMATSLGAEYGLRDEDLKAFAQRRASHVSKLLAHDGALDRFRHHPDMLHEPARFAHFYAPDGVDVAAWSTAVEHDPSLLEVVLAVCDNVIDGNNPDAGLPSSSYLASFIDLGVAADAAPKLVGPVRVSIVTGRTSRMRILQWAYPRRIDYPSLKSWRFVRTIQTDAGSPVGFLNCSAIHMTRWWSRSFSSVVAGASHSRSRHKATRKYTDSDRRNSDHPTSGGSCGAAPMDDRPIAGIRDRSGPFVNIAHNCLECPSLRHVVSESQQTLFESRLVAVLQLGEPLAMSRRCRCEDLAGNRAFVHRPGQYPVRKAETVERLGGEHSVM